MQTEATIPYANLEKYRAVPRQKVPVEEDEIRVSVTGRIPRYIVYAATLIKEKGKRKVIIKATGNAIANAITLAEILKRRFADVHQQNTIGTTRSIDTYEPVEAGLDQVTYERHVPYIEIILALDPTLVDTQASGYQPPIDQKLVRPYSEPTGGMRRGGYRGSFRRGGRRDRMGGQFGMREDEMGSVERGRYGSSMSRRGGYRSRGRRYRGNGVSYRMSYRGGSYRGGNMGGRQPPA